MGNTPTTPGQPMPMQAGEFSNESQPAVVTWLMKNLAPPTALYISRDDQLAVQTASVSNNVNYTAIGRVLGTDGRIIPIRQDFTVVNGGSAVTTLISGVEGFLLDFAVLCSTFNTRGQAFARLLLVRGSITSGQIIAFLAADYCSQFQPVAWPYGPIRDSLDGPGALVDASVANPAAGADWAFINPNATRTRVLSVSAILTTSAAVANRQVQVRIRNGSAQSEYQVAASVNITASTTAQITFTTGTPQSQIVATDIIIPLPDEVWLGPAQGLSVLTTGLQAGDQWSAIALQTLQWVQGI